MLKFFKTDCGKMHRIYQLEDGCWVSAVAPTAEEIAYLTDKMNLDKDFVRSSLDEEESSRIDVEDDQTFVIVDIPYQEEEEKQTDDGVSYYTLPMGIIITEKNMITICQKETALIDEFENGTIKNVQTNLKTRFLLTILLRVAIRFLLYLRQIDKLSHSVEQHLHKSMKNKELIQLLTLEKSLVYFSTSLKSNEVTLEKILRGRYIKLYEEDQDLLEDVLIEIKQAIEMSNIYSNILSGTMDAFASIISNNLNIVMKILTSITIVMSVPTMVSSFYGMNVSGLPMPVFWVPLALSILGMLIVAIILIKKNMFS